MKNQSHLQLGEIYTIQASVSGFCFAWQEGKSSIDLHHGDAVLYLGSDPRESAARGQPICEVLTHKGRLLMDERWLYPLEAA